MKIRSMLVATMATVMAALGLHIERADAANPYDCTIHLIDHTTNGVYVPAVLLGASGIVESEERTTDGYESYVFTGSHAPSGPGMLTLTVITDPGYGPVTNIMWDFFSDITVEFWGDARTTNITVAPRLTAPPHLTLYSWSGIANVPSGHTITVDVSETTYGEMGTIAASGGIRGFNAVTNHWHGAGVTDISAYIKFVVKDGSTVLKVLTYDDDLYSSLACVFGGDYNSLTTGCTSSGSLSFSSRGEAATCCLALFCIQI